MTTWLIISGWDHTATCLPLPPGKPCVLGVWTHLRGEGGRCQGFCSNISVSTSISYCVLLPGLLWSQPGPDPGLERERRGRGGAAGGVARPWLGLARPRGHGAPTRSAHTLKADYAFACDDKVIHLECERKRLSDSIFIAIYFRNKEIRIYWLSDK